MINDLGRREALKMFVKGMESKGAGAFTGGGLRTSRN